MPWWVGRTTRFTGRRGFALWTGPTPCSDGLRAQLRTDPALRIAALVFFGSFLICAFLGAGRPGFAVALLVGEPMIEMMEQSYAEPMGAERKDGLSRNDTMMAGYYIQHNTTIGLQCFAYGLLFGLGSLYELVSNGAILGTIFGHMATSPSAP